MTRRNRELVSIGQLAKSARCSVKALRLYAEQGLLEPAYVDPSSGYRYYRRGQARQAVTISMLRRLDLPLASIRELLSGDPTRVADRLTAERSRLKCEIELRRQALNAVERLMGEDDLMPYAITVEELPRQEVCSIEVVVSPEGQEEATTEAVRKLQLWAQENNLAGDPILCLVEPNEAGDLRLEIALGLSRPAPSPSPSPPPGACIHHLAPCSAAATTHVGPYDQLGLAHHALFAWIHERGHRELGPVREQYLNDPAEASPAELLTRVLVPIDPS